MKISEELRRDLDAATRLALRTDSLGWAATAARALEHCTAQLWREIAAAQAELDKLQTPNQD